MPEYLSEHVLGVLVHLTEYSGGTRVVGVPGYLPEYALWGFPATYPSVFWRYLGTYPSTLGVPGTYPSMFWGYPGTYPSLFWGYPDAYASSLRVPGYLP